MTDAIQKAQEAMRARREAGIPVVRLDPIEKAKANPKSLRAAVNGKCWDCCCGQRKEIRECHITACPLWNVRPYQSGADDDEPEEAVIEAEGDADCPE